MSKIPRETPDLAALLESWEISLHAEHKSDNTVKVYTDSARAFLAWCAAQGVPAVLDRRTVAAFTAHLLEHGAEPATANVRHRHCAGSAPGSPKRASWTLTRCSG